MKVLVSTKCMSVQVRRPQQQALTKVLWQEPHRAKVDDGGSHFAHNHIRVPRRDLESDHDELIEHQCCERDGNDVQKLRLEKEQ